MFGSVREHVLYSFDTTSMDVLFGCTGVFLVSLVIV